MSIPDDSLPPSRELPPGVAAAIKRELRPELRPRRRWSLRARLLAGGFAVAGLATTGAATYVAFRDAPTDIVHCYALPSRDFSRDFPGADVSVGGGTGPRSDPTEQCALLWRDGGLRVGSSDVQGPDLSRRRDVPPLVACVLPDGSAAVFPGGGGTCARLGLSQYRSEAPR